MKHPAAAVVCIAAALSSCATGPEWGKDRVLLARDEEDQSSLFDTNGDGKPDIARWYRGSGLAYEKLDDDHDGYWDRQGRRHADGSFELHHTYPRRKYSVTGHHVFHASTYSVEYSPRVRMARP